MFTIRELLGEQKYLEIMCNLHGYKYKIENISNSE